MSDKPALAIIGAGGWGSLLTDCALRSPDWDIVAFADANPEVLRKLQSERGVDQSRCFAGVDSALAAVTPDAATISIPNPVRMPYLLRLLESGASVVAEKPLAHTIADLHSIRGALAKGGGMLMVGQNYRFDPDVRAMRDVIESKAFGELEHVLVRFAIEARFIADLFYRNLEGGALLLIEMCVHHFDMMRYLLACEPETIFGRSWSTGAGWIRGNTAAQALMTFANGTRVTYDAEYCHGKLTDWGADWTLFFTNATVQWKARTGQAPEIWSVVPTLDTSIWPGLIAKYPSPGNLMQFVFDEFTAAYRERREPECSFDDNTRTLAVAHAVIRSSDTGEVVRFGDFLEGRRLCVIGRA